MTERGRKQYHEAEDTEKKRLTSKQKKAIALGAAAAATVLAAYGAYKLGYFDELKEKGRQLTGNILDEFGDKPLSSFSQTDSKKASGGIRKLAKPESFTETLAKANPLKGSREGENNCVLSAIAGFMRQAGYDVVAGSTGGKPLNPGGIVEECFKGAKVIEGSATKFGRSKEDAAAMLLKRFGPNAEGLCGVQWKDENGGHTFSWKIKDGIVSFFDSQQGLSDEDISWYFSKIDPNGSLTLARLDGAEIDFDAVSKYIRSD